ncbi:MAG TPA: DUF4179 domain-containing protein [Anaerovoracaceae bacterium]|nr:DUF4179 domain-containing protein [Anaerovoracaceae bacterium]
MKDIYELFNEMDIDVNDFKAGAADELEKARVKKRVREGIREYAQSEVKKKRNKGAAVAAASMTLIAGIGFFGLAFPSQAKEVPVIGDIFRFLDGGSTGIYDLYTESALDIDMAKEDNGIEITLNQGVYDGRTLSFTYTIKTEKDFGENLYLDDTIDADSVDGYGGSQELRQVGPGVYVGQSNYNLFSETENRESISFRWSVSGISGMTDAGVDEMVSCRLNYNVSLITLDNVTVDVNENFDQIQNVGINIENLSLTPINAILYYTEEAPGELSPFVQMEWEIKDDLGNVYEYQENGGTGKIGEETVKMENSITFRRLSPEAKTLWITPVLKLVDVGGGSVEINESGKETSHTYTGLPEGITAGEWVMKTIAVDVS